MKRFVFFLLAALSLATSAHAVLPGEQLADPKLEARARAISQELRCVVCQNQTIDDSDATLAHDLRVIVRERLKAGDSDEQVRAYVLRRYGPYVLLKPPLEPQTLVLWFGPLLILLAGAAGSIIYLRRRDRKTSAGLTKDEELELSRILGANNERRPCVK
jgi:cytochrome c-type biogenesis protein CcmH